MLIKINYGVFTICKIDIFDYNLAIYFYLFYRVITGTSSEHIPTPMPEIKRPISNETTASA